MGMREEFNSWYDSERKKSAPFSTINIRDKCFDAWQASRAALMPKKKGCGARLAVGQWFCSCGDTDMGQTAPALCTGCGGDYILGEP